MEKFWAIQIMLGKVKYNTVIKDYPDMKEKIDEYIDKRGYCVSEDGMCSLRNQGWLYGFCKRNYSYRKYCCHRIGVGVIVVTFLWKQ